MCPTRRKRTSWTDWGLFFSHAVRPGGRQWLVLVQPSGACDSGCSPHPTPPAPPTHWSSRDGYCREAAVISERLALKIPFSDCSLNSICGICVTWPLFSVREVWKYNFFSWVLTTLTSEREPLWEERMGEQVRGRNRVQNTLPEMGHRSIVSILH